MILGKCGDHLSDLGATGAQMVPLKRRRRLQAVGEGFSAEGAMYVASERRRRDLGRVRAPKARCEGEHNVAVELVVKHL